MRLIALLLLIAGCPGSLPHYDYAQEPDPRNREVTLGVGDVLGINVWENKELNADATIRPDGSITMPLIGDVKAIGETTSTLKDKVKKKLAEFVKIQGTEITVALKQWRSYKFTLSGEVTRPGVFTSDQYVRVSDAIALAGGLTRFAKRGDIKLFRTDPKTSEVREIPLDYDDLASGKHKEMNIFVLPGDSIYVP
jgi:polysaccharide export outer membrane protein